MSSAASACCLGSFGSWVCANAASLNSDSVNVSLNGIQILEGFVRCLIPSDFRKTFRAFLRSRCLTIVPCSLAAQDRCARFQTMANRRNGPYRPLHRSKQPPTSLWNAIALTSDLLTGGMAATLARSNLPAMQLLSAPSVCGRRRSRWARLVPFTSVNSLECRYLRDEVRLKPPRLIA
jgi:hypothetical protein